MYNNISLANNIRKARLYRNYSQDYMASKLGISQNGYSKIELGSTALSVAKLVIIADVLQVDLKKLIEEPDFAADVTAVSNITIVPKLLEIICRTTGMGFAAIARVTEDRWIACSVLDNIAFGLKAGGELKVETTICNEIRQKEKAVIIDNVNTDKRFAEHPTPRLYGFQSYISVPLLRRDGSFFGTLCAIDRNAAKLDNPEVRGMFELFAELIAFHLDAVERIAFSEATVLKEQGKNNIANKI